MSVPVMYGCTCPHCGGGAFDHQGWVDGGDLLGRIQQAVCIQCGATYLNYTQEQNAMRADMERRAEEDRERALRIAQESDDAERRDVQLVLWHATGGGVTLGWFHTVEEAEEYGRAYEHANPGDEMEVFDTRVSWVAVSRWEVEA